MGRGIRYTKSRTGLVKKHLVHRDSDLHLFSNIVRLCGSDSRNETIPVLRGSTVPAYPAPFPFKANGSRKGWMGSLLLGYRVQPIVGSHA